MINPLNSEPLHILEIKKRYKVNKVIVYNFEQYCNKNIFNLNKNICKYKQYNYLLQNADEVWDFDEENIKNLSCIRNNIKLHVLKPFVKINQQNKEFDILMYGSPNDRRTKIYYKLKHLGFNVIFIGYNTKNI